MIHARLALDGTLSEIADREPIYPDDVQLDAMPTSIGPLKRDPGNARLAVLNTDKVAQDNAAKVLEARLQTEMRRLAQVSLDSQPGVSHVSLDDAI